MKVKRKRFANDAQRYRSGQRSARDSIRRVSNWGVDLAICTLCGIMCIAFKGALWGSESNLDMFQFHVSISCVPVDSFSLLALHPLLLYKSFTSVSRVQYRCPTSTLTFTFLLLLYSSSHLSLRLGYFALAFDFFSAQRLPSLPLHLLPSQLPLSIAFLQASTKVSTPNPITVDKFGRSVS